MFRFTITILVLIFDIIFSEDVVIDTSAIKIRGTVMKSHSGDRFFAFRGIPYAKPPIGEKRFTSSEPYGNWDGILDATADSSFCPQTQPRNKPNIMMSEDCLYLNIYTKNITRNSSVIAYIHGGGYTSGGGQSSKHGPQYFMDKDIILVCINYRLGALGFLSTGTKEAPGNYGFKDQVLALKWIRDNIKYFGGNPNSVTIFGQSAGAMSVTLHMVSDMSKGLFHKVIPMSGSATSAVYIDNKMWTKTLASSTNCLKDDNKEMIECLRNVPWQTIIEVCQSWEEYKTANLKWNYEIEKDFGQERFIKEHPSVLIKRGNFTQVPILTGITKDEFAADAYRVLNNSKVLDIVDSNFTFIAPKLFGYEENSQRSIEISNQIKQFYLKNEKVSVKNVEKFGEIFADSIILHGAHRLVQLASQYVDVYYYKLDYMGRYTCAAYKENGEPLIVGHSDDLPYLFIYKNCAPEYNISDAEHVNVIRYVTWFTNFAKFNNPNRNMHDEDLFCSNWSKSDKENLTILRIGNENCEMISEPYQVRFELWDTLFPVESFNAGVRVSTTCYKMFLILLFSVVI